MTWNMIDMSKRRDRRSLYYEIWFLFSFFTYTSFSSANFELLYRKNLEGHDKYLVLSRARSTVVIMVPRKIMRKPHFANMNFSKTPLKRDFTWIHTISQMKRKEEFKPVTVEIHLLAPQDLA